MIRVEGGTRCVWCVGGWLAGWGAGARRHFCFIQPPHTILACCGHTAGLMHVRISPYTPTLYPPMLRSMIKQQRDSAASSAGVSVPRPGRGAQPHLQQQRQRQILWRCIQQQLHGAEERRRDLILVLVRTCLARCTTREGVQQRGQRSGSRLGW
jgi:hypothetical protein